MLQGHIARKPNRDCFMKLFFKFLSAVIFGTMLAACSSTHAMLPAAPIAVAPPCSTQPAVAIAPLDAFMQYYDTLAGLSGTALFSEYQNASLEFSRSGNDLDRVKVGVLLALPNTSFRDLQASLNFLNTAVIKDPGLKSLAGMFGAVLLQEQQSDNAVRDLAQMLKDEKKRSESLQGKIDAIKTMEKSFILRDKQ